MGAALSNRQDIAGALVTGDLDNIAETGAELVGQVLSVVGVAPLQAAWQSASSTGINVQVFTVNGQYVQPAGAEWVEVVLIGAGGAGGSGCAGPAGTNRSSGGGAWAGGMTKKSFRASDLPGTVDVYVGQGSTGGAAVGPGASNGLTGGSGGGTAFGGSGPAGALPAGDEFAFAGGGIGGVGGSTAGDTSFTYPPSAFWTTETNNNDSLNKANHTSAPNGRTTSTPSNISSLAGGGHGLCPGSGSSGGGLNTSNTQRAGGIGKQGDRAGQDNAGGAAGAIGGGDAGDGVSSTTLSGGGGGGGGGSSNLDTVDGGDGGNGGLYGAGGGGGGPTTSGGTAVSGAGGDGAAGIAIVVTHLNS